MLVSTRATIITFIILIEIVFTMADEEGSGSNLEIILENIPNKNDLDHYLKSATRLTDYVLQHQEMMDLNLMMGIFLSNVHLQDLKSTKTHLPEDKRKSLKALIRKNEECLKLFHKKINSHDKYSQSLFSVLSNSSAWLSRMRHFRTMYGNNDVPFLKVTGYDIKKMERKGSEKDWLQYRSDVSNYKQWVPTPDQSDSCLLSLAKSPSNPHEIPPICKVSDHCYQILINGSDFGYALSHRLMILTIARYARGCSLLSPMIDMEVARRFCASMYAEAEYIANHTHLTFKEYDLILEQISLCGLDGHSQFLHRTWLERALRYQLCYGCFSHEDVHKDCSLYPWQKKPTAVEQAACQIHFSAVAASALAYAIKFIGLIFYRD